MEKTLNEKALQAKYMEMQMLDQQIRHLSQQLQALDVQTMELRAVVGSLDELAEVREGTEILVPISGGIFVKAEIKNTKNLFVNVGSSTNVKKSVPDTKKLIEDQIVEMQNHREDVLKHVEELTGKAMEIEHELMELSVK